MSDTRRLLVAVSRDDLLLKLNRLLDRAPFEVHRAPGGVGALIFVANESYDLIVSELPVPGVDVGDFLAVAHDPRGPSRRARVLLIGDDEDLLRSVVERADPYRVAGLVNGASDTSLHQTMCEMMGVTARLSRRLLVELEVAMTDGEARRVCQSQNISVSGMLLRTQRRLPVGTELGVTFELPDDQEPLKIPALVVRHSHPPNEVAGMAAQFLGVSIEDSARLEAFVEAGLERVKIGGPASTPGRGEAGTGDSAAGLPDNR